MGFLAFATLRKKSGLGTGGEKIKLDFLVVIVY
jgi:hypothetical protein